MQRKKVDIGVKSSDTKKRTTSKIPSSFTTHRPIIRYSSFREEDSKTTTFNRHAIFPPRGCVRACKRARLDDACESSAHGGTQPRKNAQYLGILLKKYTYTRVCTCMHARVEKVEADACIMTFSVRFVLLSARTPARGGRARDGESEKENGDRARARESSAPGFMSFGP